MGPQDAQKSNAPVGKHPKSPANGYGCGHPMRSARTGGGTPQNCRGVGSHSLGAVPPMKANPLRPAEGGYPVTRGIRPELSRRFRSIPIP
jgi:hypothetical protein